MMASLLPAILFWILIGTETPNFYPTYPAANAAAKSHQKELVVLFTKKSCVSCETAWKAFENDGLATQRFISTILDADDFDGGVFFEKYGLSSVPSWVILASDGQVIEKWEGGWKDASGQPTLFVKNDTDRPNTLTSAKSKTETPEKSKPVPASATVISESTFNDTEEVAASTPQLSSQITAKPSPAMVTKTIKAENTGEGYVLQAGYFGSEANAQKLVSDLHTKGLDNYSIASTRQNGSTFFRVISNTYASETEANRHLQSLAGTGIKVTIKKMSEL